MVQGQVRAHARVQRRGKRVDTSLTNGEFLHSAEEYTEPYSGGSSCLPASSQPCSVANVHFLSPVALAYRSLQLKQTCRMDSLVREMQDLRNCLQRTKAELAEVKKQGVQNSKRAECLAEGLVMVRGRLTAASQHRAGELGGTGPLTSQSLDDDGKEDGG
ncbi:uncharacterized protein AKAME5_000866500 [Lates japonicus]|uniref:Uncharacterized protein n=1 Tax=Lates japonicus TaxID=270547 RepID=A0AAD3MLD5_LATJO|nr:uncharacterized protein AKAME5_000866500 [Lates japonicus]